MDVPHKHSKKPDIKVHILCDSIDVKYLEESDLQKQKMNICPGMDLAANGLRGTFWGDGNVLKLYCVDSCTTVLMFLKDFIDLERERKGERERERGTPM